MSCPICDKEAAQKYKPFCSRRCADVDLGRWFNENYRVPTNDLEDTDEVPTNPENSDQMLH